MTPEPKYFAKLKAQSVDGEIEEENNHALEDTLGDVQPFTSPRQHREECAGGCADEDDEDGGDTQVHVVMLDVMKTAAVVELDDLVKGVVVVHFSVLLSARNEV